MSEIEFLRWLVAGFAGGTALLLAITLFALAVARDTLRHMPRVTILDANESAADRAVWR